MKKDIHPELYPTIIVDTSCGFEFKTLSTKKGEETREENGVEYQVLKVEVSSASHPFYTGEQVFVDTAQRLKKFEDKQKRTDALKEERKHTSKKEKRAAKSSKNEKQGKKAAKAALKAAKAALSED